MKTFIILVTLLVTGSAFAVSPEEEIASLCNFHLDYAARYNPDKIDRWLGSVSYPGKQKFKECVERGTRSYGEGMLKVFSDVCAVLPINPNTAESYLSLAAVRYSNECRKTLIKTNIPNRDEFIKVDSECKNFSSAINEDVNGIVVSEYHRDYLKIIVENNCLKSKL